MQQRTVTKLAGALLAAGAATLVGCQDPVSDDPAGEPQVDQTAGAPASITASAITTPSVVPDEYIVVFRDKAAAEHAHAAMQRMRSTGAVIKKSFSIIPAMAGRFNAQHLAALRADPDVAYIEPNQRLYPATIYANPPPGLDRIDSRAGRDSQYNDFGFNGSGVHIFIIDTGIRTSHHEFTGRLGVSTSTVDGDPSIQDCVGHGTHVASLAAGTKYGVAKGAIVHAVRTIGCDGSGTTADTIDGLDFVLSVATTVPSVVNISLFGPFSAALNDAVLRVTSANIPVVAAAGNFSIDACLGSPSSSDAAITVGAVAANDARAGFSDTGSCIDIFAPGVSVLGAGITNDDATATFEGTSQSAGYTSGAIALFLQRFPRARIGEITDGVLDTATAGVVTDTQGAANRLLYNNFQVPAPKSCFGRCGGQSSDFSCFCDNLCSQFGDCCVDITQFCTTTGGGGGA